MNKKFLYIATVIFLITQICIACAMLKISFGGVAVEVPWSVDVNVQDINDSISVDQSGSWYIGRY